PSPVIAWKQRGGTLNDSSCLNRTPVFGVVRVESVDDVRNALRFAKEQHLKVSIAGIRHSQGGQAFAKHAVVLDMTTFNRMRFDLVVGGYGLFGVVLDADVDVVDNAIYQSDRRVLRYTDFPEVFRRDIDPDPRYALMYGHLSTAPQSLLDEMLLYTYRGTDLSPDSVPPLTEVSSVKLRRVVFNLSKLGGPAMRLKWWAEKHLEPRLENCLVSRTQAQRTPEACFVSRNEPMHDSVQYLKNSLLGETDILHEYYVP